MTAIEEQTDLDDSPAAAVNRPPVGTHDTSRVPETFGELAEMASGSETTVDDRAAGTNSEPQW
jgi:phosphomethylpyrimidine synthase